MAKRLLTIIVSIIIAVSITGCSANQPVIINSENINTLDNIMFGKSSLIEIGDGLWYDSSTKIVYWWNGVLRKGYGSTAPTPYYAPNGFPYRYSPETNTFEEIENKGE